jgi:hypothetical protein
VTSLKIGQKLWWVPANGKPGSEVTVLKVGRKWAPLDNGHRISVDTLVADGGELSTPGNCYHSQETYRGLVARAVEWTRLRADMQFSTPPDSVSIDDIAEARKLLGL